MERNHRSRTVELKDKEFWNCLEVIWKLIYKSVLSFLWGIIGLNLEILDSCLVWK